MVIISKEIEISSFNKSVLKLFSGGVIAGLITLTAMPIVTRLYTPEDFGLFQVFFSIMIVLASISSFKYEMAIVLPKQKRVSESVVFLSLICLFLTTIFVTVLLVIFGEVFLSIINQPEFAVFLPFLSIGMFFSGLWQIGQYILVRNESYSLLSKLKVSQQGINQGGAIAFGFEKSSFLGLAISYVSAQAFLGVYIIMKRRSFKLSKRCFLNIIVSAKKYKKFPLVNSVNTLLNTISLQLPVLFFSLNFSPQKIGLYMLAVRLLDMPLSLITNSISQVYLQSAAKGYNEKKIFPLELYKLTVKRLFLLAMCILIFVFLLSDILVHVFFTSEWSEVTLILKVLVLYKFFQLLNAPVASSLMIVNKQQLGLYLVIISIFVRYILMEFFNYDFYSCLMAFSISSAVFYILYNWIIYTQVKK